MFWVRFYMHALALKTCHLTAVNEYLRQIFTEPTLNFFHWHTPPKIIIIIIIISLNWTCTHNIQV